MSQKKKLLDKIINSPKNVSLDDAIKVAKWLKFSNDAHRSGTGHHAMSRSGEQYGLNFQDKGGGKIPKYQADQLIAMIEKYGDEIGYGE